MAYSNDSGSASPAGEDLYGGGDSSAAAKPEGKEEGGKAGATALIPKTILGGKEFKPGEEVVLKIVADHGDEMEVSYATENGGEEGDGGDEPAPEPEAQPPSEGSMAAMMQ